MSSTDKSHTENTENFHHACASLGTEAQNIKEPDSDPRVRAKKALENYAVDLTEQAQSGDLSPVLGCDNDIRRVVDVLARSTKNNPILIGEPGLGMTRIVEGLAHQMIERSVPPSLQCKLFSLKLDSFIAGVHPQDEIERRLKVFLMNVNDSQENVILFIDRIHTVWGTGESKEAAALLKAMVVRNELRCIGTSNYTAYRGIEKDPAFKPYFQELFISKRSSVDILH